MRATVLGLLGAAMFGLDAAAQPLPEPPPVFDEGTQKLAAVSYAQNLDVALIQDQIYAAARAALSAARTSPGEALAFDEARPVGAVIPAKNAVILDIDETVLDNSAVRAFLARSGTDYSPAIWDNWVLVRQASAIPGAIAFVKAALSEPDTTVFYITNRACPNEQRPATPGIKHPKCPQKTETIRLMKDLGFPDVPDDQYLFANENDQWADIGTIKRSDKKFRREFVKENFRVIMMVGDQLTDFVFADDDAKLRADLTDKPASVAIAKAPAGGRLAVFRQNLGSRWILLPNGQYGKFDKEALSAQKKRDTVAALGFEPALRVATWNAEWFMTPATFDTLSMAPCASGGANPTNRTLPCDIVDPNSPRYMKRTQDDIDAMARYAQSLAADVVALQEVDGPEAAALLFPPKDWNLCFTGRGQRDAAGDMQRPVQDVGFAVRVGIGFRCEAPWRELGLTDNSVRWGARITLYPQGPDPIDLLAVHLKSGCPAKKLTDPSDACVKLLAQTQLLKGWLANWKGAPRRLAILGDFNRRLEFTAPNPAEQMWPNLDAPGAGERDLRAVTEGLAYSKCVPTDGYSAYIDQVVLSKSLGDRLQSATHVAFDPQDVAQQRKLSDHCAVVVFLNPTPSVAATPVGGPAPLAGGARPLVAPPPAPANANRPTPPVSFE